MADVSSQIDKRLEKLAALFSLVQNEITPEDLQRFLSAVTDILTKIKAGFDTTAAQNLEKIDQALSSLETGKVKLQGDFASQAKTILDTFDQKVAEFLVLRPKDGVSPDVETTIQEVVKRVNDLLTPLIPDTDEILVPIKVRDALESLEGDDRLDWKAIKGLDEELAKAKKSGGFSEGGLIGRNFFKDLDISALLDGNTKTFPLQAIWNVISVDLSSFPYGSLRKNVDYTYTPTSITFTATIDAPTQLAAGQSCVLTVVL